MKYTESHEWIELSGKIGIVGVTDYAQKELGEIVYVELPEKGRRVSSGEEVAVLESTKAAADIYSPVSGTIVEVNERLKDNAQLINESPQGEGWVFKIALDHLSEWDSLLDEKGYLALVM